MQQLARKKQTRRTALKSDGQTVARQANLTEFINSPLHNPEFSALNGRANCAVHTFSGTQVQLGGLIFHQRRSFGRRQQYLDALWPLPLIPRLTLLESEKSLSASLIPFREHTKLATVLPPGETRTAVMSLIPKYPRIIVRGRCVDNSVRYDRIRANLTRCRWVPSEITSKKGKLFCAALGMEKWKSLLCVYAHKQRKSSSLQPYSLLGIGRQGARQYRLRRSSFIFLALLRWRYFLPGWLHFWSSTSTTSRSDPASEFFQSQSKLDAIPRRSRLRS
jgi:hypothetical protein